MAPVKGKIMDFDQKIKLICDKEGINLTKFSELCNIPYGTIKKYAMGKYSPKLDQINKIADTPQFEKYKKFLLSESEELTSESYPEDLTEEEKVALDMFRAEIAKGTSPDLIFQAMENIQNQEDE